MKVLIVEDDQTWRENLQGWMGCFGHKVVGVTENGDEAMRLFRATKPDLVTMDGSLANNQPGLPVAKKMRAEDPQVIIVMVTGYPDLFFEGRSLYKPHLNYEVMEGFLRSLA